MADDIFRPDGTKTRVDDHQHAREASEHALDALDNGDLSHARSLLDEAQAAVERAKYDATAQAHRETAFDCYD